MYFQKELIEAESAAREAGKILIEHFYTVSSSEVELKGDRDFVTYVDRAAEACIKDYLKKKFPDYGFLGEESGGEENISDKRWIVDPLDGTTNFIHKFPVFAVSIALEVAGIVVVGVVYDPVRDELFRAVKGEGAFLGDTRIKVSQTKDLDKGLIATGFPFRQKKYLYIYLRTFHDVFVKAAGVRRAGAAAIDLCYTAAGRLDGFWEFTLHVWDIAAGQLILNEAGGKVTDLVGGDTFMKTGNILGANPDIHAQLLPIMKATFSEHGVDNLW